MSTADRKKRSCMVTWVATMVTWVATVVTWLATVVAWVAIKVKREVSTLAIVNVESIGN